MGSNGTQDITRRGRYLDLDSPGRPFLSPIALEYLVSVSGLSVFLLLCTSKFFNIHPGDW